MSTKWNEITIDVPTDAIDHVTAILYANGALGLKEEDSEDQGHKRLVAYFLADEDCDTTGLRLTEEFDGPIFTSVKISSRQIETKDWQLSCKQIFKPYEIVPGIIIAPSWEDTSAYSQGRPTCRGGQVAAAATVQCTAENQVITIDPGMAFGTGLHETTRMCAEAIYSVVQQKMPKSILDVGTGSGILAIVASRLGIKEIAVVENDADALKVAMENFELNSTKIFDSGLSISEIDGQYQMVVANILQNTLIELKKELIAKTAKDGYLILSGITNEQEEEIINHYGPSFNKCDIKRMGEWSSIICHNSL